MSVAAEMRKERIERLLQELRYEISRGIMEAEVDERMGFSFVIPASKQVTDGIVLCRFETRPVHRDSMIGQEVHGKPRLELVK